MSATLCDAVIFSNEPSAGSPSDNKAQPWTARYYEEMPIAYAAAKYAYSHRLIWFFAFDGQKKSIDDSVLGGTGFEPWLMYLAPCVKGSAPTCTSGRRELLRLSESVHTSWYQ